MTTLILTDNASALQVANELRTLYGGITIFQSENGPLADIPRLNVRAQVAEICKEYELVISIHCKQLFPSELVKGVRCINVHPGINPFNRGWYPHVFSIVNGMKAGVTIHEMDEQIDHGPIIVQKEYKITSWDTSETAYAKIMRMERGLLLEHFTSIRDRSYRAWYPGIEGNINYRRDFEGLRRIDLNKHGSFREFLNHLRALTHGDHKNAYFVDDSGQKVFVRIVLDPESSPVVPADS